jgi:hypothetical protein
LVAEFSVNSLLMSLSVMAIWAYFYCRREMFAPEADPRGLARHCRGLAECERGIRSALVIGFFSTVKAFVIWVVWPWLVTFW